MDKRDNLIDTEMMQKLIDDMYALQIEEFTNEAGGEVKDSEYEGITSKVKDQQRLNNMSISAMITHSHDLIKFNLWFDNYSFGYVPSFAKPLIKQWVKAAYLAGLDDGT